MSINDFFNQFPIKEPIFLSSEDLYSILLYSYSATKLYKKEEKTMSKEEKIESYKAFCRKEIYKNFEGLDYEGRLELDKFINLFVMYSSIQHLVD